MNKAIIIAGVGALLIATGTTGVALAQAQAPARAAAQPAPPPGMPGMPGMGMQGMQGMQGMRGDRMERGRGGEGRGFRGGTGRGPTPQEMQQLRQQRNAALFAELDANKDGRATLQEFQALQERRRAERQRQMFQRFSGGKDSVTLQELNARTAERFNQGSGRRAAPGTPPAAPAAPAR